MADKTTISVRAEDEMLAALNRICAKRGGASLGGILKEFASERLYELDEVYRQHIDAEIAKLTAKTNAS